MPPKGFKFLTSGTSTEQFLEKSGIEQVPLLDSCNSCLTDIQDSSKHILTSPDVDSSIIPLTITTPHIEERLVRDEQTNEMYFRLTSTVVLKREQYLVYLPLGFNNKLTVDAFVAWGAYASAIFQSQSDTMKQKVPKIFFKTDYPTNFQIQVANWQLEKSLATTTLELDSGSNTHFSLKWNRWWANHGFALYDDYQRSHWHNTWPYTFITPDNADQNSLKKMCKTPSCPH